jgi:poly(glycerol-phosphate) alpha-glucosyltransferase
VPIAVLEAWSYGLPVVITPQCNLADGLAAGCGVAVDPNADSIAAGLTSLMAMSTPELLAMGLRGRKLVEEKYTWGQVAGQLRQVYQWVLGLGDKPTFVECVG